MKTLFRPVLPVLAAALASSAIAATPTPDGKGSDAVMTTVKDVCLPLLKGAQIASVAKTAGLKNGRDGWVLPIAGKRRIEIEPPDGPNPHVCSATVIHAPGADDQIVKALTGWAASQTPGLQPVKSAEKATGPLYQLTTSSWSGKTADGVLGLSYSEDKTLDGKPVAGNLDQATLAISLTPSPS